MCHKINRNLQNFDILTSLPSEGQSQSGGSDLIVTPSVVTVSLNAVKVPIPSPEPSQSDAAPGK